MEKSHNPLCISSYSSLPSCFAMCTFGNIPLNKATFLMFHRHTDPDNISNLKGKQAACLIKEREREGKTCYQFCIPLYSNVVVLSCIKGNSMSILQFYKTKIKKQTKNDRLKPMCLFAVATSQTFLLKMFGFTFFVYD